MWIDGKTLYVQSNISSSVTNSMSAVDLPSLQWSFPVEACCLSVSKLFAIKQRKLASIVASQPWLQRNIRKQVLRLFGRLNDKISWDLLNLNFCLTTIDSLPPFSNVNAQNIYLVFFVETMGYISFLKYVPGIWFKSLYWNQRSTSKDTAGRARQTFDK